MLARAGFIGVAVVAVLVLSTAPASAKRTCGGAVPTITGSAASDSIEGTRRDDVIRTGGGDDAIDGRGGNDLICGGAGDDLIIAGEGDDQVRGGAGDDRGEGEAGGDVIRGQGGADEARGAEGTDACLVERHSECEADLRVSAAGPLTATGGDQTVFKGTLTVDNEGPTPSVAITATGTVPPPAEFVAESSDPRCLEVTTDELLCGAGSVEPDERESFAVDFRFPDCPPAMTQQATFGARVRDFGTTDPLPGNDTLSISLSLVPAASCPQGP